MAAKVASEPTISYINLPLRNANTIPSMEAVFNLATQGQPLFDNTLDYELSLVRFSVDTENIPIMIAQMQVGGATVNDTVWTVTLKNNGATVTKRVIWVPQFAGEPTPSSTTVQDVTSRYYWVSSYNHLLSLFNKALLDAYGDLPSAPGGSAAPFFRINPSTSQLELVAMSDFYDNVCEPPLAAADLIEVYMNQASSTLFRYFDMIFDEVTEDDEYALFLVGNTGGDNYFPPPVTGPFPAPSTNVSGVEYIMTQTRSSLGAWNSVQRLIVEATANIPVVQEAVVPALPYGSTVSSNSTSVATSAAYLTDFCLDGDVLLNSSSGRIIYLPSSEYRMMSLTKVSSVMSISLRFLWADSWGNTRPLTLARNTSADIKLMIRPKPVYQYKAEELVDSVLAALRALRR